jgi:hypothetical protein
MKPIDLVVRHFSGNRIPGDLIAYFKNGTVDSIGLLITDYDAVGVTWQPVFFSDPSTPISRTLAEWFPILLAHGSINLENVICSELKGFAVYPVDTSREMLNKALRWFGLPEVVPEPSSFNSLTMEEFFALTEEQFKALNQ